MEANIEFNVIIQHYLLNYCTLNSDPGSIYILLAVRYWKFDEKLNS